MLAIINVAYLMYGAAFTAIKWSKAATSVACPWPYPDAKVFDPQGFYEKNGRKGPYSVGIMSTWMSGQPQRASDCATRIREPTLRAGKQWVSRADTNPHPNFRAFERHLEWKSEQLVTISFTSDGLTEVP